MGRFRFTQQFDKMDCGPACIRMVAMHYGKTYSLLLKFYSPTEGTITLGGKDIALFKADSIRKNTGIVMQDNYIF